MERVLKRDCWQDYQLNLKVDARLEGRRNTLKALCRILEKGHFPVPGIDRIHKQAKKKLKRCHRLSSVEHSKRVIGQVYAPIPWIGLKQAKEKPKRCHRPSPVEHSCDMQCKRELAFELRQIESILERGYQLIDTWIRQSRKAGESGVYRYRPRRDKQGGIPEHRRKMGESRPGGLRRCALDELLGAYAGLHTGLFFDDEDPWRTWLGDACVDIEGLDLEDRCPGLASFRELKKHIWQLFTMPTITFNQAYRRSIPIHQEQAFLILRVSQAVSQSLLIPVEKPPKQNSFQTTVVFLSKTACMAHMYADPTRLGMSAAIIGQGARSFSTSHAVAALLTCGMNQPLVPLFAERVSHSLMPLAGRTSGSVLSFLGRHNLYMPFAGELSRLVQPLQLDPLLQPLQSPTVRQFMGRWVVLSVFSSSRCLDHLDRFESIGALNRAIRHRVNTTLFAIAAVLTTPIRRQANKRITDMVAEGKALISQGRTDVIESTARRLTIKNLLPSYLQWLPLIEKGLTTVRDETNSRVTDYQQYAIRQLENLESSGRYNVRTLLVDNGVVPLLKLCNEGLLEVGAFGLSRLLSKECATDAQYCVLDCVVQTLPWLTSCEPAAIVLVGAHTLGHIAIWQGEGCLTSYGLYGGMYLVGIAANKTIKAAQRSDSPWLSSYHQASLPVRALRASVEAIGWVRTAIADVITSPVVLSSIVLLGAAYTMSYSEDD